jgi:arabinofuranosyltransferase
MSLGHRAGSPLGDRADRIFATPSQSAVDLRSRSRVLSVFRLGLVLGWVVVPARMLGAYRLQNPLGAFWGMPDDMYVTASFARTLVEGGGLRWFDGAPKVEGFSNPLWVLVLALLHALPGFEEEKLGFYVGCVNGVVMVLLALTFVRCLEHGMREAPAPIHVAAAVFLTLMICMPLCFWVGAGFETGVVALLSLTAFRYAVAPASPLQFERVALFVGLAFFARMDALIPCVPAVLTAIQSAARPRTLLRPLSVLLAILSVQFLLRRWYFGDWLPNTYYLKATGWPLHDRLSQGFLWSLVPVVVFVLVVAPGMFALRRSLDSAYTLVSGAIAAYGLTLVYSIWVGGDFFAVYGHNRFTSVGTVYLALALACGLVQLRSLPLRAAMVAGFGLVVGASALRTISEDRVASIVRFFDLERPAFEPDHFVNSWNHHGKLLREVSRPGARIAVCGAGALIYFSHRGGVDLLGKVEPIVAHQRVREYASPDSRCWRGFPGAGHNKEDVPAVFALRQPELTLVPPPATERAQYTRVNYREFEFFARNGTSYLDWAKVRRFE